MMIPRHRRPELREGEKGFALVLVAMSLVVLVLMAALAVDVGLWYNRSSKAQRAADSAALAAVSEYAKQRKAGATVANSQTAAAAVAVSVAKENGFDNTVSGITVTTTWSTGTGGAMHVVVRVTQANVRLFFSSMFSRNVTVSRSAEATMSSCQATCSQAVRITNSLGTMIDTGTGGDGWQAVIAGRYVFNLYHHDANPLLMCVDKITNTVCTPGTYPAAAYTGQMTNYTPKLTASGTKVYFVVQTATSTGLGCWDGATGAVCPGFTTPLVLAPYAQNADNNAKTRIDGPETVGNRLFMYGDDNRMYCYDKSAGALCTGYPKAMPIANGHDMKIVKSSLGFAGGVDGDGGVQFDMIVHPDGRIFTSLGPTTDSKVWLQCWDPSTDAACSGFTNVAITAGRPILSFNYTAAGVPDGLCGRAAKRGGGSGSGMECVTLAGAAQTKRVTLTFDSNSGQQEASAFQMNGHFVTFFPFTGAGSSGCWDWTTNGLCAIAASNWDKTTDYAYTYDGAHCIIGLGHEGYMWSFSVDTGQWPCNQGQSGGSGRFYPCTCADGTTKRWTLLSLNQVTDLDDFTTLRITIRLPDGTIWFSQDLVQTGATSVDLRLLNSMSPMPAYVDVDVTSEVVSGRENEVFNLESDGIALQGGTVPTLVN